MDQDPVLGRREEHVRDRHVDPLEAAEQAVPKQDGEPCRDDHDAGNREGVGTAAPGRAGHHDRGQPEAHPLTVGSVLPAKELPGTRLLEKRVEEVPLIPEQDVDRVTVDDGEQPERGE